MKTLFILLLSISFLSAQPSDSSYLKTGLLDGNEIKISFYNDGQVSGYTEVRGNWKNNDYIGDMTFMIGLELPIKDYNNDGIEDIIHSVIIPRGTRKGQMNERHPQDNHFRGFNPLPGFMNLNSISPAMSNDNSTWPSKWSDHPEWEENVWNGLNGPNNFSGDLETFFVIDDFWDDEFNNEYGFLPDSIDKTIKGHGINVSIRYNWGIHYSPAIELLIIS